MHGISWSKPIYSCSRVYEWNTQTLLLPKFHWFLLSWLVGVLFCSGGCGGVFGLVCFLGGDVSKSPTDLSNASLQLCKGNQVKITDTQLPMLLTDFSDQFVCIITVFHIQVNSPIWINHAHSKLLSIRLAVPYSPVQKCLLNSIVTVEQKVKGM